MASFAIPPRSVPRTGDSTPARSLLRYVLRMSGRHQLWLCLIAMVVAALSLAPLELQRRIVNEAIGDQQLELLSMLGAVYLAVLLIQGGLKLVLRMYQGWVGESAIRYNRQHLSEIYECRKASTDGKGEGQAVSIIGTEVDKLGGFVGEGLSQPVVNVSMLLAVAGYMLAVEPVVALLGLLLLVPQAVAFPLVQRSINKLVAERLAKVRALSDTVAELPQDCGDLAESELPRQLDGIYANRMRTYLLKFALKAIVNFLNALAPLAVLLFGGYMVIQGETTLGVVVAFMSGFDRLAGPLRELLAYYRVASLANVQHCMIARWM